MKIHSLLFLLLLAYPKLIGQSFIDKNHTLGDQVVTCRVYKAGHDSVAFVHVHENEATSLEAGLQTLQKTGGKLVTLMHSKGDQKARNVTFTYKDETYHFDPNRIFTYNENVLQQTVLDEDDKPTAPPEVLTQVKGLAMLLWNEVANAKLIVALHNNKNEPAKVKSKFLWFGKKLEEESYNITSYVKKFDVSSGSNKSCEAIFVNPRMNNSDFFIVTQRADFTQLMQKNLSVVLQNNNPVDDGSMSVYAWSNKKRYINAEAKHGRLDEQSKMLQALFRD